ncbi:MAG: aminoacyl-tRNA hydrolase [Thermodesulfobacteriota bacterium]
MFAVLGLGNPGSRYAGTRHNVGVMVVERLAARHAVSFKARRKWWGWGGGRGGKGSGACTIGEGSISGRDIVLAKPTTFMNLSGEAALELAENFSLAPERIIVVCDDCDLPLGKVRIRKGGGSGGHRGLDSIIAQLGTNAFPRIRLGVGKPDEGATAEHVLGPFAADEEEALEDMLENAASAVELFLDKGIDSAMNAFN